MTVRQLISILETMPPDDDVILDSGEYNMTPNSARSDNNGITKIDCMGFR